MRQTTPATQGLPCVAGVFGLLLGRLRAGDLRVDAYVVERARDHCDYGVSRCGAVLCGPAEVSALTGRDQTDDQPDGDDDSSYSHGCLLSCRVDYYLRRRGRAVDTPARCNATHSSPAVVRVVALMTVPKLVVVSSSRSASPNSTAAMIANKGFSLGWVLLHLRTGCLPANGLVQSGGCEDPGA